MPGAYYNDLYVADSQSDVNAQNNHLAIENEASTFIYFVPSSDNTKLYKLDVSDGSYTQIDIDPGDAHGGDDKSRAHNIRVAYHDRATDEIWFCDAELDAADRTFDIWKLDTTDDSVTEIGTGSIPVGGLRSPPTIIWDILKLSSDYYIFLKQGVACDAWKVTAPAFTEYQGFTGFVEGTYTVTIGGLVYWAGSAGVATWIMTFDGTNWAQKDNLADFRASTTRNLEAISYDGSNILSLILKKTADGKNYLANYNITGDSLIDTGGEYNVALMLDRNSNPSLTPEYFTLEKGFGIVVGTDALRVYQISRARGNLNLISITPEILYENSYANAIISVVTDTYLIVDCTDDGGAVKLLKFQDVSSNIIKGIITHDKEDWPDFQMVSRRDKIPVEKNMFMQIFGTYSANSDTNAAQVIFEGLVKDYDDHLRENVLVENQGSEVDHVEPTGDFSGLTNSILNSINSSSDVNYITDGTFSAGQAMGTITFGGDKSYYRILSAFKDQDEFTWYLKPISSMFYDDATVDTGADLLRDQSNSNAIWHVELSHPSRDVNRVVVKGAINAATGAPYSGSDSNAADQQLNGIIKLLIRDATLDSNSLCNAKADKVLSRDNANPTKIRFAYRKTSVGFIQPGQTITFSYVTNDVSISSAQYIVDRIVYDIKTDIALVEASSGLIFNYGLSENYLPEENSQLIEQNAAAILAGGAGETNTGDNVGADGVGVFDGKVGVELQFRHVAPGSTKITTVLNGNDVDVDISQSDINHDSLLNFAVNEHFTEASITHNNIIAGTIASHDTTATGAELNTLTDTSDADALHTHNLKLNVADIDDVPVNAETAQPISSNWAFDHKSNPANIKHLTDAQLAALHAVYTDAEAVAAVEAAGIAIATTKLLAFDDGGSVDIIRDEDNMASDDVNALATQQSIKKYVDDNAGGVSQSDFNAASMIGAANSAWVPLAYQADNQTTKKWRSVNYAMRNIDGTDTDLVYLCTLPTNRGGKKLYCTGVRIALQDADAGDYVDKYTLYGRLHTGATDLANDGTNRTAAGTYDDTFVAVDCSSYHEVIVWVETVTTNANDLDISNISLQLYYDD